jgi:hypothetical protein
VSLRRLDRNGCYDFHLNSDARKVVQAFPKLEELTVRGDIQIFFYRTPLDEESDTDEESDRDEDSESSGVGNNGRQGSNNLTSLDLSHSTISPLLSILAQCFKDLGDLEAISSLKFGGSFDYGRDVFPENTFSQWTRLQSLHLDVMTNNLRGCTLQSVADQCPSLRELVLRSSPYFPQSPFYETYPTPEREPFHISNVLFKCPKLERLLISRGKVVEQGVFLQLVREGSEAAGQGFVIKGPVLQEGTVLVQEFTEDSDAVSNLEECKLYRAVLPVQQPPSAQGPPRPIVPRISTNRSASARQVIGEIAIVQSWRRVFGEGE